MTNYHLASIPLQDAGAGSLARFFGLAQRLAAAAAAGLSRWRTRRALEILEPRLLADLGVPHEGASVGAGPLERYDGIIRPRRSF